VASSVELGLGNFSSTDTEDCAGCVAEAIGNFGTPPIAFSTSGTARASADYGTLRAFGRIDAFGEHTGSVVNGAKASASFQDTFFINSVSLNGQSGMVNIPINFVWSVTGASSYPPGTALQAISQYNVKFFAPNGSVTKALLFGAPQTRPWRSGSCRPSQPEKTQLPWVPKTPKRRLRGQRSCQAWSCVRHGRVTNSVDAYPCRCRAATPQ
jgi:hypothetical protein